jgi:hypothetical protein
MVRPPYRKLGSWDKDTVRPPSRKLWKEVRRRNSFLGRSKKTDARGKIFKKLQISKKKSSLRDLKLDIDKRESVCRKVL